MQATPMQSFQPTHSHQSSDESVDNCGKCNRNPIEIESDSSSQNSSSQQNSESFSIQLKANRLQHSTPNLNHLENQIRRLASENQILIQKNKELLIRLQEKETEKTEKTLKRQLKAKQKEIKLLKDQLRTSTYGLSPTSKTSKSHISSAFPSKKKLQSQDSERLKSNKSRHAKNEYFPQRNSMQLQINEVRELRDKWKVKKIELQRHICVLQEKLLVYESETSWMLNLASKVIGLSQKLGNVFKQKPIDPKWSAKKQAKQAWRYLKHILNYFLMIQ